ncbi:MLO-like protein 9 [Salvia divinorum]|uniref:MLO-like protein 9 n=1 Tax=Salvia divinorum TaxID=28513 RepID=A0ABD1FNH7_SALDI
MSVGACFYVCFFRHLLYSVQKPDYSTLRHGFVSVHLSPGTKFDFQKYIKRSLEDDFKVIVGIPYGPYLWMTSVVYLLLNVKGGQVMFILSIFPLLVILAVGTKLPSLDPFHSLSECIRDNVLHLDNGIPSIFVLLSLSHEMVARPKQPLLMQYEFGLHSCFHKYFLLAVIRVCIGVGVQVICSYITLPLYALTQMGSHMKKSIFDEQTSKALMSWHNKVKKKHDHDHVPPIRTKKLGECDSSPEHSSAGLTAGAAAIAVAQSSIEMFENSPREQMTDIDLLSGP